MYVHIIIHIYIERERDLSLSLSLSMYTYIYIYTQLTNSSDDVMYSTWYIVCPIMMCHPMV